MKVSRETENDIYQQLISEEIYFHVKQNSRNLVYEF